MQSNPLPEADEILQVLKEFAVERKWHLKYAKFNWRSHQSLLAHCLNVSSLSSSLLSYMAQRNLIQTTDKLRIQVLITGFLHDAGKENEGFQNAVEAFLAGRDAEPLDYGHQQAVDIQPVIEALQETVEKRYPILSDYGQIWQEVVWSIGQIGRREDAGSISQSFTKLPSNDALVCKEVVHLADVLMSRFTVEDAAATKIEGRFTVGLRLEYSRVSTVRGVLTQFLHLVLEDQFRKHGYEPIQWFSNGTVYVGIAGLEAPQVDESELASSLVKRIQEILGPSYASKMAKAAYGNLMGQVIAAPEFLFASDGVIHQFWQYISSQSFSKPKIRGKDELRDTDKRLLDALSDQLKGRSEDAQLSLLARFVADFNLIIILYAARKQLKDRAGSIRVKDGTVETESTGRILKILCEDLEIPEACTREWPEIAVQTKVEERSSVAAALWQSPFYSNLELWRPRLTRALERATKELADLWQEHVPDQYLTIARLLISDVTNPLRPKIVLDEVDRLNSVIAKGKTGHGTPTCQVCGAEASVEAQAKLFGKSEIYSDLLIAGRKVGGGNKLQVCDLCEFEQKLRSVFIERSQEESHVFYVFPQLALSRKQQYDWQTNATRILYNRGEFPPLLRVERWAELGIDKRIPTLELPISEKACFSEKELARVIQFVADRNGLEEDLSSMIEPALDARDGESVQALRQQGKCKLKRAFEEEIYADLNRLQPVYISPNFVLILTNGTVARRDEPASSAEIKWALFRSVLAKLFSAAILSENQSAPGESILGYTPVPANITLRILAEKLCARSGWIAIPELDDAIVKLSALILVARELSSAEVGYGSATLLRLLDEEPGRVLIRLSTSSRQVYMRKMIDLLDTWTHGYQITHVV